ncbi:metal-dependent hydrolase [Entomomonas sp. E2T0]|uniref:metal-dependent hydrolase n=1 Tax=Entomomonas sp. E2T0 TaxID=2930213 RepID=UPI00222845CC|nr:metal-dependent hydrolase [Entomomonas sp. E2T0]UYZ84245.1 metal-dependent hydrolase [Entomomonas sp. E2T0]
MSPITHFLVGWACFEPSLKNNRDKAIVCLAGLVPDLDGIGIVIDFITRLTGLPETNFYQSWHRLYGHGIAAAIFFTLLASAIGIDKIRVAIFTFLNVHLHFLCDLVGSRGSTVDDLWGLYYLGPFDTNYQIIWQNQWQLVSWQNTTITIIAMLITLERASRKGYSLISLISKGTDKIVIEVLRKWRYQLFNQKFE